MGQGPGKYIYYQEEICEVYYELTKRKKERRKGRKKERKGGEEGNSNSEQFVSPGPGHTCPRPGLSLKTRQVCSCLCVTLWVLRRFSRGIKSFISPKRLSDPFTTPLVVSIRCPEELQGWDPWGHVDSCAWLGFRRLAQLGNNSLITVIFPQDHWRWSHPF